MMIFVFTLLIFYAMSYNKLHGTQPNMILTLIDDVGWGDLGTYGHPTINTPNLDFMAKNGVKFTQFYSASPVCTPSRAAFLSGRFPVRHGLFSTWNNSDDNVMINVLHADSRGKIPHNEILLPKILKTVGYHSILVGKWHLGLQPEDWPQSYGFDEFYGTPHIHGPNHENITEFPNMQLIVNGVVVGRLFNEVVIEDLHQLYLERIVKYIDLRNKNNEKFLIIFTPDNTHIPLHANKKYQGKSKMGIYGDTLEESDDIIGQIMKKLVELQIHNDTLMFFSSDNGGDMRDNMCGDVSTLNCEIVQAGTNGQLKGGKGTTWEGGIRVPGIFYWPNSILNGSVSHEYGVLSDIFPTMIDLAGVELPKDRSYDGYSLLDVLTNNTSGPHEFLYHWRGNTLMAVTHGQYKAHWYTQGYREWNIPYLQKYDNPLLYNIWKDPSERFPYLSTHPIYIQVIPILQTAYENHVKSIDIPQDNEMNICDIAAALWKPYQPTPPSNNYTCCQDPCKTW